MITRAVDTGNRLNWGAVLRDTNDRTLYILVIGAETPTRPKVLFTYRCGESHLRIRHASFVENHWHLLGTRQQRELRVRRE